MSKLFLVLFGSTVAILTLIFISQQEQHPSLSSTFLPMAFAQGSNSGDYTSYENSDNGFTIDYPSNWQVDDGNPATFQPASGTLGDTQQVQVIVTAENNPVSSTLQGYTNYEINYLRNEADGFRLYQLHRSTLSGLPAVVLEYGGNGYLSDGLEKNAEIYAFDEQGTLYKVEYSASPELFSSYFPIAENMVSSFELSSSSSSSPSSQPSESPGGSSACPTPGPGGCNGAFSNGPGSKSEFWYSPITAKYPRA
jgi:hypothetical protein